MKTHKHYFGTTQSHWCTKITTTTHWLSKIGQLSKNSIATPENYKITPSNQKIQQQQQMGITKLHYKIQQQ